MLVSESYNSNRMTLYFTYCLLAVSVLYICVTQAAEEGPVHHPVTWTRDGVKQYTPSNPLVVSLGDNLVFKCPNGSYSNMWRQTSLEQYNKCDCAAAVTISDDECGDSSRYFECIGDASQPVVQVVSNSEMLGSARDFTPGTYYLISYSDGVQLGDAFSERGSGGECTDTDGQQGLKMVLHVQDPNLITDTTEASVNSEKDKTDSDSLTPDETDSVSLPNEDKTSGVVNELESGSGTLSNIGELTDSATSLTTCATTLLLLVLVALLS